MNTVPDDLMLSRLAFSMVPGMTLARARRILERMDVREFFTAEPARLISTLGINEALAARTRRNALKAAAEEEAQFIYANNVTAHWFTEPGYPHRLSECDDAPAVLYTMGQEPRSDAATDAGPGAYACDLNAPFAVSIVGTRHATPYGLNFTRRFVEELSLLLPRKPLIISGLAFGIDIAAHRAAIDTGCPTVAVLAHGLTTIYPAVHRRDAVRLASSSVPGALVTDYTSKSPVHRGNFLARNRIVAGMADAVIVVESAARGGARVTAKLAADYNRSVFALPGRTSDTYSEGCNSLIAANVASLITSARDVVNSMRWPIVESEGTQKQLALDPLTPQEQAVVDHLAAREGTDSVDHIASALPIPINQLMQLLVEMEFKGILLSYPGGSYRLA